MADIEKSAVEVSNPLALIQRMVDSKTEPAVIEKMMDLAERWEANQAAKTYAAALTGFQAECPQVKKSRQAGTSGKFAGFSYASLDDVMRVISPLLRKYGVVITFTTRLENDGIMTCVCRVRVGTHTEDTTVSIPIPTGSATNVQLFGQAVSYSKRYALCAALNIIVTDEDNDASVQAYATASEIAEINRLIEACEEVNQPVNMAKFLKWLRVESLEDLPKAGVEAAIRFLGNRAATRGGRS